MTNLMVREWLNGALIPLNICILFVISYSIWESYRRTVSGWMSTPGVQSAVALWFIFAADLIRSCLAWSLLHAQSQGRPLMYLGYTTTMFYIVAGVIAALATFRLTYTLSPSSWGHKGWLSALGMTIVFMLALWMIQ